MNALDVLTVLLLAGALFFFVAGAVGVLRFPDLYSRLHALTKADNVALGLTVSALMFQAETWPEARLIEDNRGRLVRPTLLWIREDAIDDFDAWAQQQ